MSSNTNGRTNTNDTTNTSATTSTTAAATTLTDTEFQVRLDRAIRLVLQTNFDADSKTCFSTLLKVIDNVLQTAPLNLNSNAKQRSLRTQNPAIRSRIVEKHGHHVLLACGFVLESIGGGGCNTTTSIGGGGIGNTTTSIGIGIGNTTSIGIGIGNTTSIGIGIGIGIGNNTSTNNDERLTLRLDSNDIRGATIALQRLIKARHTLARIAVLELKIPADSLPRFKQPIVTVANNLATRTNSSNASNQAFDVYKGNRFDGQSASIGTNLGAPVNWKSKTEQDLDELKRKEQRIQKELLSKSSSNSSSRSSSSSSSNSNSGANSANSANTTIDRQWTVLLPGQQNNNKNSSISTSSTNNNNTSSNNDSQLLASHALKQQTTRLAAERRGFTTKAMRDLEKLKKARVYSHTQLAVHFPDAVSIRANFGTNETMRAVIDGLLRDVLLSDVGTSDKTSTNANNNNPPVLELYQTPPRTILDPSKTLKELNLVPTAKIYVGWKNNIDNKKSITATATTPGWYIRPELLHPSGNSNNQNGYATAAATMPISVKVVGYNSVNGGSSNGKSETTSTSANANANKRKKKTKAEKEAALMKRMLGK